MLSRICFPALRRLPVRRSQRLFSAGASTADDEFVEGNRSSIAITVDDRSGSLQDVLGTFSNFGVNMTRIESKPNKKSPSSVDFYIDFDGVLSDPKSRVKAVRELEPIDVMWFPTHIGEIDKFSGKDKEYRKRREMLVRNAQTYLHGDEIPRVDYTEEETKTWGLVYENLKKYTKKYGVRQYNQIMPLMEKHCGYAKDNIPQLQDISVFLQESTGFSLRPVAGLLSARDFLNALAYRVFFSTQYIRHHSVPFYTPEPDICHELMGHAPMFADPDFADFSHEIGLASLGASDEVIKRLATCYWFSVEFGLCKQDGMKKAYGAGLLSSFGELEYSCAPYRPAGGEKRYPTYKPWEPEVAAVQSYPITTYQPIYFVAESLHDAKQKMRAYCESLPRPFSLRYNHERKSVSVDRNLRRGTYTVTLQT